MRITFFNNDKSYHSGIFFLIAKPCLSKKKKKIQLKAITGIIFQFDDE